MTRLLAIAADGGYTLDLFWSSWDYFREAALSGTVAGALLGFLGVYIVLRRMVFLSAAVSQASGLGVAYAFYVDVTWGAAAYELQGLPTTDAPWLASLFSSPLLVATLAALATTLALAWQRARNESFLGLVYLFAAAGTLILGTRIVQELQDIQTLLFGNAVVVLEQDFHQLLTVAAGIAVIHLVFGRGFRLASFDPLGARTRRIPVRMLDLMLLATLAVAISTSTRILGALPVFAFSILPAMAAVRLSPNPQWALALAAAIGAGCGFVGYVCAFLYEVPVGAAQTLVAAAVVGAVVALRTGWDFGRHWLGQRSDDDSQLSSSTAT